MLLDEEDDLLYIKKSCYIERWEINYLELQTSFQLSMTPEFEYFIGIIVIIAVIPIIIIVIMIIVGYHNYCSCFSCRSHHNC